MPPNWKECLHFQKVTQIWKGTALKTKSHPAFTLVTIFPGKSQFQGIFGHLHLLSHRKPCEQCQPHYSFHVIPEVCCPEGLRNKAQNCNWLGASRQKGSPRKNTVTPKPKNLWKIFFFPQNSSAFYHKTWNKYLQLPSLAWFWLLGFAEMTWNINFQMYFLLGYLASWGQQIRGLDAFADPLLTSKQNSCMFW